MSEFVCENGHEFSSHEAGPGGVCPCCASNINRMDGLTNKQLKGQERQERMEAEREEDED